jgi:hypothetical protein
MTLNDDVMILPTHFEKQSPSGSMITVSVSKAKKSSVFSKNQMMNL